MMTMLTTHGGSNAVTAVSRDEKCPFLCQSLEPLTLPLVPLVPLTLPSFLLVIAPLFLSSITSHPFPSRPSFLLSPFLLPLLPLKSYSPTLTHPYFSTHCVPCNSSSPPLIGCFVPLICQARRAQNTSQHSSPITDSIPYKCPYQISMHIYSA